MVANVVVFVRNPDTNSMLLLRRDRPDDEQNRYNGVSAGLALGETPLEGAMRALRDKIGLTPDASQLRLRAIIKFGDNTLFAYYLAYNTYAASYRGYNYIHCPFGTDWGREPLVGYCSWLIPLVLSGVPLARVTLGDEELN
jgi:hypothetical protein